MKCYRDRETVCFHAGGFCFVKNIVVIIDLSCVYISFLLQWEKEQMFANEN